MIVLYLKGLKKDAIKAKLSDKISFNGKLFSHQLFCEQVVNLLPGQLAVITNGRAKNLYSPGSNYSLGCWYDFCFIKSPLCFQVFRHVDRCYNNFVFGSAQL